MHKEHDSRCLDDVHSVGSLVSQSRGYSLVAVHKHLTVVTCLVAEPGLEGMQASAVVVHSTGLIALQHVKSSRTRNGTCVLCTGR